MPTTLGDHVCTGSKNVPGGPSEAPLTTCEGMELLHPSMHDPKAVRVAPRVVHIWVHPADPLQVPEGHDKDSFGFLLDPEMPGSPFTKSASISALCIS